MLEGLQKRVLIVQATGGRFKKLNCEKDLISKCKNYGLKWGSNPCYQSFYYWNHRLMFGMHQSCFPDWLHTIYKGMVEKVLSWCLIVIHEFGSVKVRKTIRGGKRHGCSGVDQPWVNNESLMDYRISHFPIHLMYAEKMRCVRFPEGLSSLLKKETTTSKAKKGKKTTGLLTAQFPAWKLTPALFQLMLVLGHDGAIVPNRQFPLSRFFPGITEPLLQDVTHVLSAAMSATVEFVFVVSCKEMRERDLEVMYYLTSVVQYQLYRLNMLMRVVTEYDHSAQAFSMPPWHKVLPGSKKHLWKHVVDAKVEFGPHLRTWDTELAENCWKFVLKAPNKISSKKASEKNTQMCNHMRDMVAIEELEQHISLVKTASKKAKKHPTVTDGDAIFTVHPVFLSDELVFDATVNTWMRGDSGGDIESRFAHPLLTTDWIHQQVVPFTSRYLCLCCIKYTLD